jgi:hypothetical protein
MQTKQNFLILSESFIAIAFSIGAKLQQIQILMMHSALLRINRIARYTCSLTPRLNRRLANTESGMFIGNQALYPRKNMNNTLRAFRISSDNWSDYAPAQLETVYSVCEQMR